MIRQREQYSIDVNTGENFPKIIVRFHTIVAGPVEPLGVYLVAPLPGKCATFTPYIADSHDLYVVPGDIPSGNIRPCASEKMSGALPSQADESHDDPLAGGRFTRAAEGRRSNHVWHSQRCSR